MKKRILAVLLCLMMICASLPAAADPAYVYPEVKVLLLPDETEKMEMEFRQWAQRVLYQYYGGRYGAVNNANTSGEPYSEYYRLAATKGKFDGENVMDDDVIYNTYRDADWTQNEGVYTWVLIESMKEAVLANEDAINESYDKTPEDERRYLILDLEDGDLQIDDIAIATQAQAEEYAWNAGANLIVDVGLTAVDAWVALTTTQATNANSGFDEMVNAIIEAGDTLMESLVESVNANAKRAANNLARETMINSLAMQLYNYDVEIVRFLRNTYSTDNTIVMYGHDALVKRFIDMIDPETNPQIALMLAQEAVSYYDANAAAISAVTAAGQKYHELMDVGTMVTLAGIEVYGEIFTGTFDALQAEIDNAVGDKYITYKGKTAVRVSWATLSEILLDTLSETVSRSIDDAIDELYEEFNAGKEIDWRYAVNKVNNKLCENLSDGNLWDTMGTNLLEAVPELAFEIAGGNEPGKKGRLSGYKIYVDLLTAGLDSETVFSLAEDGELSFEKIKEFITNLIRAYNTSMHENEQNHTAFSMTLPNLESKMKEKWEHGSTKSQVKWENEYTQGVVNFVLDVCDRAWETGESLRELSDSIIAAKNGEGIISLHAARVVAAHNLSNGVRGELRSALIARVSASGFEADNWNAYAFVMDPEQTTLEEVVRLVSYVHTQIKYDIIGTRSYYNITFQGSKDEKFRKSEFWKYVENKHTNIFGQKGFINNDRAQDRYNWVTGFWQDYYVDLWNSNWQVFLNAN